MNSEPIEDLLDTLWGRGIRFRVEDGKVILNPADLVSPEEVEELRSRKPEVLAVLLAADPPAPTALWPPPQCVNPRCARRGKAMLRTVSRRPSWICGGCWATCAQVEAGDWGPEAEQHPAGTAGGDVS
jgi:hypothetical protein